MTEPGAVRSHRTPAPYGPRRLALRDRSIRTKIMAFAVVGFALLAVSGLVGVTRMAHVCGAMLTLVENEIPAALVTGDLRTDLGRHHQLTDQLILATTADGVADVERAIAETEKAVDEGMDEIIERASDPNDASEAEEARGLWQARISEIIEEVDSYQTTIASAVEEQTATTSQMSRNVSEAATGSGSIAGNIEHVASAAQSSSTGIVGAQRAAAELAQLSGELSTLVSRFTV